jgi:hypothetical protein
MVLSKTAPMNRYDYAALTAPCRAWTSCGGVPRALERALRSEQLLFSENVLAPGDHEQLRVRRRDRICRLSAEWMTTLDQN